MNFGCTLPLLRTHMDEYADLAQEERLFNTKVIRDILAIHTTAQKFTVHVGQPIHPLDIVYRDQCATITPISSKSLSVTRTEKGSLEDILCEIVCGQDRGVEECFSLQIYCDVWPDDKDKIASSCSNPNCKSGSGVGHVCGRHGCTHTNGWILGSHEDKFWLAQQKQFICDSFLAMEGRTMTAEKCVDLQKRIDYILGMPMDWRGKCRKLQLLRASLSILEAYPPYQLNEMIPYMNSQLKEKQQKVGIESVD